MNDKTKKEKEQEIERKAVRRNRAIENLRELGLLFTERVAAAIHAMEAAEVNRRAFEAILMAHRSPFIRIDHRGYVFSWNQAAESVFGWTAAQAIAKPLTETIVPERLGDKHKAGFFSWHPRKESLVVGKNVEMPARCADGREINVRLRVEAIENMQGNGVEFIALLDPEEEISPAGGRDVATAG